MLSSPRKYLLRWCYDYPQGAVSGGWSGTGISAWDKNKSGLLRARIEGKDLVTKEVKTLAECPGVDFRVFQWMAAAMVPSGMSGTIRPMTKLIGLKIMCRDTEIAVLDTGEIQVRDLLEDEKRLSFATYGK